MYLIGGCRAEQPGGQHRLKGAFCFRPPSKTCSRREFLARSSTGGVRFGMRGSDGGCDFKRTFCSMGVESDQVVAKVLMMKVNLATRTKEEMSGAVRAGPSF